MQGRFDYFVVFAEMRTGSNFLEANLNMFDDLSCHGEAFNPVFIGYPEQESLLGITQEARDVDPVALINAVKFDEGLAGFRYFNTHDARVLDTMLDDPRCAKIILTRNPIDSYVSLLIANATGQWKLTNVNHVKSERVTVDIPAFEAQLAEVQDFQVMLQGRLQKSGQTAFYVAYEDLQDVDVMNGLAQFLGSASQIKQLNKKLKKQNPAPMSLKVENFEEMTDALARMDRFNLNRTPNFEPRRGPMIPTYVAAPDSPLLFMPVRSGPDRAIRKWLAALDGKAGSDLQVNFSQSSLRNWKRARPGHVSFTVLRHPIARAHAVFCERILPVGGDNFKEIRATLRKVHHVPLPDDPGHDSYDDAAHRAAFLAFLKFLKPNLAGQTSTRVDPTWATQMTLLQGFAEFGVPDHILREDSLARDLRIVGACIGRADVPEVAPAADSRLRAIYDRELETACRDAYARDYVGFGFRDWEG
jgi:LPS sulfotransferase NodH